MLPLIWQWMVEQGWLAASLELLSRALLAGFSAFILMMVITPIFIRLMAQRNFGQVVRKDGPKRHLSKTGVPTMGGLPIILATASAVLFWADLTNHYLWMALLVMLAYGLVGLWDDWNKIVAQNPRGLGTKNKYLLQSIIALGVALWLFYDAQTVTDLFIPFLKYSIALGPLYILLCYLVLVGTSNAVNLTDGLDGLAILPVILIALVLALLAVFAGDSALASAWALPYVERAEETAVFCGALAGAGLGFLWFNSHPATIFMGDVGSLALGAGLGIVSIILRHELLLFVMAGVFVAETVSVICQVGFFKLTGQRIFRMAPLHHHFELAGWAENQIVVRFWVISVLLVLIALSGVFG